jgi:hypothetical protein
MEPRDRDERDSQAEREELADEYRRLGAMAERDPVIMGLIAELRVRLAERVKG